MGSSGFPLQPDPTPDLMMFNFLLLVTLAILAAASPVELENTEIKAASPLINCGCQCSSLTFRDANGVVQGNCLTVDSTGAQWCYVDSAYSSCQGSPLCPVLGVYPPTDSHHHHDHHHDHHYSPEQIGQPRETEEELAVATKDQVNFITEEKFPSK